MVSCTTCRWTACRNYGYDRGYCYKYIPSLEEVHKQSKNKEKQELEKQNSQDFVRSVENGC